MQNDWMTPTATLGVLTLIVGNGIGLWRNRSAAVRRARSGPRGCWACGRWARRG